LRVLLFMLGICVGIVGVGTHAEAQNYPWYAIYSGRAGGGTNCGFTTFEQAWIPRGGSAAFASQIRNMCLHLGRIDRRRCKDGILIEPRSVAPLAPRWTRAAGSGGQARG